MTMTEQSNLIMEQSPSPHWPDKLASPSNSNDSSDDDFDDDDGRNHLEEHQRLRSHNSHVKNAPFQNITSHLANCSSINGENQQQQAQNQQPSTTNGENYLTKAPKKEKKTMKSSKRFKIFGSMRKPNGKRCGADTGTATDFIDTGARKTKTMPMVTATTSDGSPKHKTSDNNIHNNEKGVYDFSYLGHRRYLKDVIEQQSYEYEGTSESYEAVLHEQLLKNDSFNSAFRSSIESVNSIQHRSYELDKHCDFLHRTQSSREDHVSLDEDKYRVNTNRSRSQSTQRSNASRYGPQSQGYQNDVIMKDRGRSQSTNRFSSISYNSSDQIKSPHRCITIDRSRSQSTHRSMALSNGQRPPTQRVIKNDSSASLSTHHNPRNTVTHTSIGAKNASYSQIIPQTNSLTPSAHDFFDGMNKKHVSAITTPDLSRTIQTTSRTRGVSRSELLSTMANANQYPGHLGFCNYQSNFGNGRRSNYVQKTLECNDDGASSQVSDLSMTSPTDASNKYFFNKMLAMNSCCRNGLDKSSEAKLKTGRFCAISQMIESDSDDDSSEDSSCKAEDDFVDITINRESLLQTTSSITTNSTHYTASDEEEEDSEEEQNLNEIHVLSEKVIENEGQQDQGIYAKYSKKLISAIKCTLSDCFVPLSNSPPSMEQHKFNFDRSEI
jgi:hypothetical protein